MQSSSELNLAIFRSLPATLKDVWPRGHELARTAIGLEFSHERSQLLCDTRIRLLNSEPYMTALFVSLSCKAYPDTDR